MSSNPHVHFSSSGKLSPDEQKIWMKKMVTYANYTVLADDVIVAIKVLIVDKLHDGDAKKILLASCDSAITGLQKAYSIFKDGYTAAEAGNKPDFSKDIDFPPAPPSPSSDSSKSIVWFQVTWNAIANVLNIAALHSNKLAEILPGIIAAGNKLVSDIEKEFGKPQDMMDSDKFPVIKSLAK